MDYINKDLNEFISELSEKYNKQLGSKKFQDPGKSKYIISKNLEYIGDMLKKLCNKE